MGSIRAHACLLAASRQSIGGVNLNFRASKGRSSVISMTALTATPRMEVGQFDSGFCLQVDHSHPQPALWVFGRRHGFTTRAKLSLASQYPHTVHKRLVFLAQFAGAAVHHPRVHPIFCLKSDHLLKAGPTLLQESNPVAPRWPLVTVRFDTAVDHILWSAHRPTRTGGNVYATLHTPLQGASSPVRAATPNVNPTALRRKLTLLQLIDELTELRDSTMDSHGTPHGSFAHRPLASLLDLSSFVVHLDERLEPSERLPASSIGLPWH